MLVGAGAGSVRGWSSVTFLLLLMVFAVGLEIFPGEERRFVRRQ